MMITFYKTSDESIKVNKNLTTIKSFDGSIMSTMPEVVDPVIQVPLSNELLDCNYLYIPEFNRYYFAKGRVINGGIIEFSAHCDVLMTYKDEIKNLDAIVSRQENVYNLYQNDAMLPLYVNKKIQYLKSKSVIPLNPSYILITAG